LGLEQKPEGCLIQLREQDDGTPIRKPSPVIIKKSGKLSDLHGGDTARKSTMYQAMPDS
jgi:hypothetical protein